MTKTRRRNTKMSNYDELKKNVKAAEEGFYKDKEESQYKYEKMLSDNFQEMKKKITDAVKDLSREEITEFVQRAASDDSIDYKLYLLTITCWEAVNGCFSKEKEKMNERDVITMLIIGAATGALK